MVEAHTPEKCFPPETTCAEVVWFELPEVSDTWPGKPRAVWDWKARSRREVRPSDPDGPSVTALSGGFTSLPSDWLKNAKQKAHPAMPHQVLLPSETLAGTALRSIQKDTQDSMTIRVAGK